MGVQAQRHRGPLLYEPVRPPSAALSQQLKSEFPDCPPRPPGRLAPGWGRGAWGVWRVAIQGPAPPTWPHATRCLSIKVKAAGVRGNGDCDNAVDATQNTAGRCIRLSTGLSNGRVLNRKHSTKCRFAERSRPTTTERKGEATVRALGLGDGVRGAPRGQQSSPNDSSVRTPPDDECPGPWARPRASLGDRGARGLIQDRTHDRPDPLSEVIGARERVGVG